MDLAEAKAKLTELEPKLVDKPVVEFAQFQTPHGPLTVFISDRLRKKCRKARIWKTPAMLTALKNASYGYDENAALSRGGSDGIFRVDRAFKPTNLMIKKLFAQFLDKPDALVPELEEVLCSSSERWIAVRLVSHHLRLLGVLSLEDATQRLVLVDYDTDKNG